MFVIILRDYLIKSLIIQNILEETGKKLDKQL